MKKKILILLMMLLLTGCSSEKEETKKYEFTEENSGIIVITEDKNVNDNTKVNVEKNETDYSSLSEDINKHIAYDISLSNDDDKVNIKTETEVYLKIPNDYDTENLVVYYVLDNKIEETFNVEVVEKNKENYAMFKTDHFSTYVLVELKEKEEEEEKESTTEDSSKETDKKENNKTNNNNTNTNKNNTSNNNTPSSSSSINLVGNWKYEDGETYYTFNSDYSGI